MLLSRFASKRINWQLIDDSAVGLAMRGGEEAQRDADAARLSPQAPEEVTRVFETARREFQRTLRTLALIVRVLMLIAGLSAAASIGGLVVATVGRQLLGGAIFTGAGTASLLTLFTAIRAIGRDQAMLELLPMRYELALQLATTATDRRKILARFLDETASLRR